MPVRLPLSTNRDVIRSNDVIRDDMVMVTADEMERIAEEEIRGKFLTVDAFDEKHVKDWCNEISRSLRGKFIKLTDNQRKVVVTTYMVPKMNGNVVGVYAECRKHADTDNFFIVAVECEYMFVWVNIFLSAYI